MEQHKDTKNPPATPSEPQSPPPSQEGGWFDAFKKTGELAKAIESIWSLLVKIGSLSVFLGLLGDVLKPLASINLIAFSISSSLAVLFYGWIRWVKASHFARIACLSCFCLAVGFGGWWALASFAGGRDKGFLAAHIPFVEKLQSAVVTKRDDEQVIKIDGGKLGKEVDRQLKAEKTAATTLQEVLQGFPANLIRAEVTGEPRIKKKSESAVVLEYDLQVSVDTGKYDSFVAKLLPILDKIATEKGETFAAGQIYEHFDKFNTLSGVLYDPARKGYDKIKLSHVMAHKQFGDDWWKTNLDKESQMVVVVNTKRSGADDRTTWRWYHIPLQKRFGSLVKIDVVFDDKEGQELSRDQFAFLRNYPGDQDTFGRNYVPGMIYQQRRFSDYNWQVIEIIIAPYHLWSYGGVYCRTMTIPLEITLTPAEVSKLGLIRCSVVPK